LWAAARAAPTNICVAGQIARNAEKFNTLSP